MPGKPPEPPAVTAQMLADWRARRGRLLALLHDDPGGPWAWLWRVHVGIVDYLIHRYADRAGVAEAGTAQAEEVEAMARRLAGDIPGKPTHDTEADADAKADAGASSDLEADPDRVLRLPYDNARVEKAASLEGPAAERLRDTLRGRLSSLNQTNDERRRFEMPILPAPPPKRPWYLPPPDPYPMSPERFGPTGRAVGPMPVWLERVLWMEVAWPPRLADAEARPEPGSPPPVPPHVMAWLRRVNGDAPMAGPAPGMDATGVEPMDDAMLSLLCQAMQDEDAWDLSSDTPLSEEEIARLLEGADDQVA